MYETDDEAAQEKHAKPRVPRIPKGSKVPYMVECKVSTLGMRNPGSDHYASGKYTYLGPVGDFKIGFRV